MADERRRRMMGGNVRRSIVAGAVGLLAIALTMGPAVVSAQTGGGQVTLQVSPSTDLTDGQTVTVEGEAFVFNGEHRVLQCIRGAADNTQGSLDLNRCDPATTVTVTAVEGSITTPFTVASTITVGGAPVDCVVVGACEVAAVFATNTGPPAAGVAIEFAGARPATTSTTTTTAAPPAAPAVARPSFTG